ncbi:MAG TPA: class I SAM-dependent methyltransferase [Ignavibacteria bacterium]|mgnify:CR=1 FL=1|nr:class I SAM-dependent methyltransferase [Ignavibacteria bacterium]
MENEDKINELKNLWDKLATDWEIQVGKDGDNNRRLNSDPVLWEFAGDVKDLNVLDAGCGSGYLSNKLWEKGANVTGVDISEKMIEIAQKNNPQIQFHTYSISDLSNIQSDQFDIVISNYVLMDTPELQKALDEFYRVLKQKGNAIAIFSHPCFNQAKTEVSETNDNVTYFWEFPYFTASKRTDPPWAHFKESFIWFHRPLSDYWKAFRKAGFNVVDFEEPRIAPERYHLAKTPKGLKNSQLRPYSVAFKLEKP